MLKQIKYFQSVVKNNSFSVAAEECFISQSAISQQIQALERELGVMLLQRENRKFMLTPAGEYFYKKSLLITADLDRLCRETVRVSRGGEDTLRVGYLKSYGGNEFQKAVAQFTEEHPEVTLDIKNGTHEEIYNMLRLGCIDLAMNDQRRAFSDEYVNELLAEIPCCIEISSRSPIAQLKEISVYDLRNTPCILVSSKNQFEHEQMHYREIYGIESEFLAAENLEEARLMVIGGNGFMPVEGGDVDQYAITRVPLIRNDRPVRTRYAAFWKVDNTKKCISDFADILKAQF